MSSDGRRRHHFAAAVVVLWAGVLAACGTESGPVATPAAPSAATTPGATSVISTASAPASPTPTAPAPRPTPTPIPATPSPTRTPPAPTPAPARLTVTAAPPAAPTAPTSAAVRAGELQVQLDVPAEVAEGSAIPITIRLRNGGGTPITFVRPALVPALVYLTVENEAGMRLPFLGPSALARDFERHDFITLAPGETTDRSYDLADFYPMPAGSYTLQAEYVNRDDGRRFGLAALVTPRDAGVFSDPVTLTVRP